MGAISSANNGAVRLNTSRLRTNFFMRRFSFFSVWIRDAKQNLARKQMERVMGIEPTSQAWEARILPLNHTREITVILQKALASVIPADR